MCSWRHIRWYMSEYGYRFVRVSCRVVSYSHEDLVPEVALGGDGGGRLSSAGVGHAEAGVVGGGGVGEGRHGGVGGREVVVGAAAAARGRRRPAAVLLLVVVRGRRRRHRGPPRRGGLGRPRAVGSRVHAVAPPGGHGGSGGRGRGGRRRWRRRGAGDGGLGALLRHALHAHAQQLVQAS